jgi:hypothetical protein
MPPAIERRALRAFLRQKPPATPFFSSDGLAQNLLWIAQVNVAQRSPHTPFRDVVSRRCPGIPLTLIKNRIGCAGRAHPYAAQIHARCAQTLRSLVSENPP